MVDMKSLLTMQGMMFTMLLVGVFIRRKGIVTSEGRKSLTNLLVNPDSSLQYSLRLF